MRIENLEEKNPEAWYLETRRDLDETSQNGQHHHVRVAEQVDAENKIVIAENNNQNTMIVTFL